MTVAYVKERRQFARPVGSFQALKHRLADVWGQLSQARAAARYAAACLADGGPDAPVAVAPAKAACGDAAVHATRLGSGSQARRSLLALAAEHIVVPDQARPNAPGSGAGHLPGNRGLT